MAACLGVLYVATLLPMHSPQFQFCTVNSVFLPTGQQKGNEGSMSKKV